MSVDYTGLTISLVLHVPLESVLWLDCFCAALLLPVPRPAPPRPACDNAAHD